MQYISDCDIIKSLPNKVIDTQSIITEDNYSMRAIHAVYDALHSYLNDTKKIYSLNSPRSKKQCYCDLANALHHLAIAIGESGEGHRLEIDILNEALRFRIAGDDDKTLITETQLQLASCYQAVGDLAKAISSYNDALRLTMDVHGSNSASLPKILYHMGVIYCEQFEYDSALEYFVRGLTISESQETGIPQSEDISKMYSWIGNVYREKGDSQLALSYFLKALQTMRALSDIDNLDSAEIMQNIGIVNDDLGKDENSLRYLFNCLEIRRKLLDGELHPSICETLVCIANVYRKTDIDKALRLFRIVLNAREKHPNGEEGDQESLLMCYEDMLEVAKTKLKISEGNNELHIEIASLYFRIGSLMEKRGRYTLAIENYHKALKVRFAW
jgi:tetratricopeptide (TPR) repeat protein